MPENRIGYVRQQRNKKNQEQPLENAQVEHVLVDKATESRQRQQKRRAQLQQNKGKRGRKRALNPLRVQGSRQQLQQGMSKEKIAKKLGVTRQTLYRSSKRNKQARLYLFNKPHCVQVLRIGKPYGKLLADCHRECGSSFLNPRED